MRKLSQYSLRYARRQTESGFTLLEVLIALVVIAFGLLGVAGMQALAISNTSVARMRSLAALQASSLAAAMTANETYWTLSPPSVVTVTGSTLTSSADTTLVTAATTADCTTSACTTARTMAAYDLAQWGTAVAAQLPSGTGKVECSTTGEPVNCIITVYWTENNLALNQMSTATASNTQNYQMVVQP